MRNVVLLRNVLLIKASFIVHTSRDTYYVTSKFTSRRVISIETKFFPSGILEFGISNLNSRNVSFFFIETSTIVHVHGTNDIREQRIAVSLQ